MRIFGTPKPTPRCPDPMFTIGKAGKIWLHLRQNGLSAILIYWWIDFALRVYWFGAWLVLQNIQKPPAEYRQNFNALNSKEILWYKWASRKLSSIRYTNWSSLFWKQNQRAFPIYMGDSFVTLCKIKAKRNSPSFLRERGSIKWIYMFWAVSPQCCRFFPFSCGKICISKALFSSMHFFHVVHLKTKSERWNPPECTSWRTNREKKG